MKTQNSQPRNRLLDPIIQIDRYLHQSFWYSKRLQSDFGREIEIRLCFYYFTKSLEQKRSKFALLFFYLVKSQKIFCSFTWILPDYVAHKITKENMLIFFWLWYFNPEMMHFQALHKWWPVIVIVLTKYSLYFF